MTRNNELTLNQDKGAFFDTVENQAKKRVEDQPVIAAAMEATPWAYDTLPAFQAALDEYIETETVQSPAYRANKFFKAEQFLLLQPGVREAEGYAERFDQVAVWKSWLLRSFGGKAPAYPKFREALARPLQVNRPARANILGFMEFALNQPDYSIEPVEFTVNEYGSAANIVLNALAIRLMPWSYIYGDDGLISPGLTSFFNASARSVYLGSARGIELTPPKTEEDYLWVKSCTADPSRLGANGFSGYEKHFDTYAFARPQSVQTIQADFMNFTKAQDEQLKSQPAHIALLSHVLPQVEGRISEFIDKVYDHLDPRGLLVVHDYAKVDPDNPKELIPYPRWHREEWLGQTIVREVKNWDAGYYSIMEWRDGHSEEGRITHELGRLIDAFDQSIRS